MTCTAVGSSLCFALSVKRIVQKKGKLKSLKLVAVPTGTFNAPAAEVIARLKDFRKKEVHFSSSFEELAKLHQWDSTIFHQVKCTLIKQIEAAKKNIEPFVNSIDNALRTNPTISFSVSM